jgi:hypothetical protein
LRNVCFLSGVSVRRDRWSGVVRINRGTAGALDRVAQIAVRKYCRPQARPFRLGFPSCAEGRVLGRQRAEAELAALHREGESSNRLTDEHPHYPLEVLNCAADIFRMAGHMLRERLLLRLGLVVSLVNDDPQPFPRRRD